MSDTFFCFYKTKITVSNLGKRDTKGVQADFYPRIFWAAHCFYTPFHTHHCSLQSLNAQKYNSPLFRHLNTNMGKGRGSWINKQMVVDPGLEQTSNNLCSPPYSMWEDLLWMNSEVKMGKPGENHAILPWEVWMAFPLTQWDQISVMLGFILRQTVRNYWWYSKVFYF